MKIISQGALTELLDQVAREKRLIAPVEEAGTIRYRPVGGSGEIAFDFARPLLSIKEAFFPPTETLLTIARNGGQVTLQEVMPEEEQVIFGVRPCDARGVKALDAVFSGERVPPDPYYGRRRQQTTLIGLACREMGETCFCTSVGGAPDEAGNVDLMLTEVEDGYAVEAITSRGESLLQGMTLTDVTGAPSPPRLNDPVPVPAAGAWAEQFEDAFWAALGERCLSCRLCAYVCPTCRCFDVRDEPLPAGQTQPDPQTQYLERVRCWDSCTGANYRRVAGGHNPRAEEGERLRNRFFCKFDFYPQQYGPLACTGCGRCIDVCPVNVDVTEVLAAVAAMVPVKIPEEVSA